MKVISGNKFVYFDVDDTLVDWNNRDTEDALPFANPDNGCVWMLEPKWNVIKKLKEHKRRGDTVIVWSQGGWDWCKEVVTTLKLEDYVDAVMTKPHAYYDDLHVSHWMTGWVVVSGRTMEGDALSI